MGAYPQSMKREAALRRREHAKEILRKNPDLGNKEVRERAGCCDQAVREIRKELRAERGEQ